MFHVRDRERLLKQPHVKGDYAAISRILDIENLIMKRSVVCIVQNLSKIKSSTCRGKPRQLAIAKALTERVERYDLLCTLAEANARINIS